MGTVQDLMIDAVAWQESWDRQQEAYMPDREQRFTAMLDAVEAVTDGGPVSILDLAGGTGSISLRALARFPQAEVVVLDIDPVLTTIARASLAGRGTVVAGNLNRPEWTQALPHTRYDAVLTATALHWLAPHRLAQVYGEIRDVMRPGAVFINADHMPDDGLPGLGDRLAELQRRRRDARWAAGAVLSWDAWWQHVGADPVLGPLMPERVKVFADRHTTETDEPVSWHLDALRSAGFSEVGLIWRGAIDAAVTAVR